MSKPWTLGGCTLALGLLLVLGGASSQCSAEIYQWKDKNGKTVFSERPPKEGGATVVKPKTSKPASNAGASLSSDRAAFAPPAPPPAADAGTSEKPKELTPEEKAQQANACEQARNALALLQANNRPKYIDENNQSAFLSEEQKAERVADAEKKIADYCK